MDSSLERWNGKVCLVTGATSGIGRATAIRLSEIGMRLAVSGRRAERLDELREILKGNGAEVLLLPGDQTEVETNRNFFERVRQEWGGVDVLVNNAGTRCGC